MLRRSSQPNSRGQDLAQFQSYNFSKGIRRTDNPSATNSGRLIKNFEIEDDGSLNLRRPLFLKRNPNLSSEYGTLLKIIYPFTNNDDDIIYATTKGFFNKSLASIPLYSLDKYNQKLFYDENKRIIEDVDFANFNTSTIISGVQVLQKDESNDTENYKYRFLRLTYNEITNFPELQVLEPFIPTTNNFTAGDFNYYSDVLQALRDDYLSKLTLVNVIHNYALYIPTGNEAITVKDLTRNEPGIERWRMFESVAPGTEIYLKAFFNVKREDMHRYYCTWEYTEDGINWFVDPEFVAKFSTGAQGEETTSVRKMKRIDKTIVELINDEGEIVEKKEEKTIEVSVVPFSAYTDDDLITSRPDILFITADNVTRRFSIFVLENPEIYEKYNGGNSEHFNWLIPNKGLTREYLPTTSLLIQKRTNLGNGNFSPTTYDFAKTNVNGSVQIQGATKSDVNIFTYDTAENEQVKLHAILVELDLEYIWNYTEDLADNGESEIFIKLKGGYIKNNINYQFEEEELYSFNTQTNGSFNPSGITISSEQTSINNTLFYGDFNNLTPANDIVLGEYSDNSELVVEQKSSLGVWIDLNPESGRINNVNTLLTKLPIRHVGDENADDNVSYFGPYYTILNKNRYNYVYLPTLTLSINAASVREYYQKTIEDEINNGLDTLTINDTDRTFKNFAKNMNRNALLNKKLYLQIPIKSENFKTGSRMDFQVFIPKVEITTESVKAAPVPEGDTPNKPLNLIVLSELESTVPLSDVNDIIESDLKYPASAKRIINFNKSIYAYSGKGFRNNVLISGADDMLFPISNLLDLDSRENVQISAVIPWRNYLLVATESAIYLVDKVEGGFTNKAINTFIGINEKDGPTFKAILNGTILKSGRKIFSLTPNPASSDDSILNIQDLGSQLTDLVPDSQFINFGYTTEKYYGVFIKVASGSNPKTLLFKYYYAFKNWVMQEFPIDLIQVHFPTINEIILTDSSGKEYYLDKENIEFFDIFKYGDSLNYTQEQLTTLASARRNYKIPDDAAAIEAFDALHANSITPFEFELDSGEKANDYLYEKYFLESKFVLATLESTKGYFPVSIEIYTDGIKSVVKQDVKSSSNFWATDQNTLATLSTTNLAAESSNLTNIVKTLTVRHAGKGKTVRHVLKGQSLNYFKFLQVFYKYRLLPGQN